MVVWVPSAFFVLVLPWMRPSQGRPTASRSTAAGFAGGTGAVGAAAAGTFGGAGTDGTLGGGREPTVGTAGAVGGTAATAVEGALGGTTGAAAPPTAKGFPTGAGESEELTMAAGSGRVIADLISGRTPEIPIDGLTMARYGR